MLPKPAAVEEARVGDKPGRVGIVFRGDAAVRDSADPTNTRLAPVFAALAEVGLVAEAVVYSDARADQVRQRLSGLDGVLVWADPVSDDGDRVVLDEVLRQAAAAGVWVGSHPDVIAKMGTKEVLYRTRSLGWGTDTHLYTSAAEFARRFPAHLGTDGVRVLKPSRGNAGIGVWKVALLHPEDAAQVGPQSHVRLQHALIRDHTSEETTLGEFMTRCQPAFAAYGGTGTLIDQAFCRRIDQGIVRCYMVRDRLVGFARQYPKGLFPHERPEHPSADPPRVELIMGLPSHKTMYRPDEPAFQSLRVSLEDEWLPGMQKLLDIQTASLPALWDADFLFGPPLPSGEDSFILCEINASSVMPFPPEALPALASATKAAVAGASRSKPSRGT